MGGREKHAAGTLKFSISISTSGRGNLRRRGELLRASRETEAPNSSHHLFLYITQNPTARGGCKVTQQRGGPGTPTWDHLPAPWWGPSHPALSQQLRGCLALTALVSLCCPCAGSESRGQGLRGGFGISFKFNQLWAVIGEALVLAQPCRVPWPHGY